MNHRHELWESLKWIRNRIFTRLVSVTFSGRFTECLIHVWCFSCLWHFPFSVFTHISSSWLFSVPLLNFSCNKYDVKLFQQKYILSKGSENPVSISIVASTSIESLTWSQFIPGRLVFLTELVCWWILNAVHCWSLPCLRQSTTKLSSDLYEHQTLEDVSINFIDLVIYIPTHIYDS